MYKEKNFDLGFRLLDTRLDLQYVSGILFFFLCKFYCMFYDFFFIIGSVKKTFRFTDLTFPPPKKKKLNITKRRRFPKFSQVLSVKPISQYSHRVHSTIHYWCISKKSRVDMPNIDFDLVYWCVHQVIVFLLFNFWRCLCYMVYNKVSTSPFYPRFMVPRCTSDNLSPV